MCTEKLSSLPHVTKE